MGLEFCMASETRISNYILTKTEALAPEICDKIIEAGNTALDVYRAVQDDDAPYEFNQRNDRSSGLKRQGEQLFMPNAFSTHIFDIQKCVMESLREYVETISSLSNSVLLLDNMKFQYQPIGGGFHSWHHEQASGESRGRAVVWAIYLNDVQEGGETEYLYQHVRLKPQKGMLAMWPAGYTHPHRGNPCYTDEKYILTGWLSYAESREVDQAMRTLGEVRL
jgi:hypothetical protein